MNCIKDSYIFTNYVNDSSDEFYNTFIAGVENKIEDVKSFVKFDLVNYLTKENYINEIIYDNWRRDFIKNLKIYKSTFKHTDDDLRILINKFIEDYLRNEPERDRILRVFLNDDQLGSEEIYEILKDDEIEIDDDYYFVDWLVEIIDRLQQTNFKGNYMEFINEQISKFNNNEYFYILEAIGADETDKDTEHEYILNHRCNIYCKATMLLIKKYKINSDEEFVNGVIKLISTMYQ